MPSLVLATQVKWVTGVALPSVLILLQNFEVLADIRAACAVGAGDVIGIQFVQVIQNAALSRNSFSMPTSVFGGKTSKENAMRSFRMSVTLFISIFLLKMRPCKAVLAYRSTPIYSVYHSTNPRKVQGAQPNFALNSGKYESLNRTRAVRKNG